MNTNKENAAIAERQLTFGEKAVGIQFNPGKDPLVNEIKKQCGIYIDLLQSAKEATDNPEKKRMLSIAITEAQTSQMWGVKAATWQY